MLARPDLRRRLDQLRHRAVERGRPLARELGERLWDAANDAALTTRHAVSRRRVREVNAAAEAVFATPVPPEPH